MVNLKVSLSFVTRKGLAFYRSRDAFPHGLSMKNRQELLYILPQEVVRKDGHQTKNVRKMITQDSRNRLHARETERHRGWGRGWGVAEVKRQR